MKRGIALGTPICDGLWVGAVVACIGGEVLCVEMGADPLVAGSWRLPHVRKLCCRAVSAYVCRTEADRARVIASWHRRCGRLDWCECEAAKSNISFEQPHHVMRLRPRGRAQ